MTLGIDYGTGDNEGTICNLPELIKDSAETGVNNNSLFY